jgi:hypothetical protein
MQFKLFEINTDTYYRRNSFKPFESDINLDGLVAQVEKIYDYREYPANHRHTETVRLTADPNARTNRGLYVLEFIGNGISSRAIIQKGSLTWVQKATIAGHIGYIVDENGDVCKGKDVGLYIESNFYKADPENGRIVVPFGRNKWTGKALIVVDTFA